MDADLSHHVRFILNQLPVVTIGFRSWYPQQAHMVLGVRPVTQKSLVQSLIGLFNIVWYALGQGTLSTLS